MASKRWWFIALTVLTGVILFRHVWLWLPAHRYESLISNTALVHALSSGDSKQVRSLAKAYHYDYQIFQADHLLYSSNSYLPNLRIFQQQAPEPGVIVMSLKNRLQATEPYQTRIASHRYIFFAVSPSGASNQLTYVIYGKVL